MQYKYASNPSIYNLKWLTAFDTGKNEINSMLMFERNYKTEKLLMIHNLKNEQQQIQFDTSVLKDKSDLLGQEIIIEKTNNSITIEALGTYWIKLN